MLINFKTLNVLTKIDLIPHSMCNANKQINIDIQWYKTITIINKIYKSF